ncbi:MAG: outer membrane lipoprotein carrier protein LolA [Gammaproteobacteria bacterium]|nr:outer membrane lipoprotein carrier protein LolA [Gammaproteobacteria bacterium]
MTGAVVLRIASSAWLRRVAAAGWIALALPAAPDDASPAARLISRLVLPVPAITPFVEVRYSALLTRPLLVSGELEYRGPRSLHKHILAPYHEQQLIDGDRVTVEREGEQTRRFSLQRSPELKGILDSLGSLLAGDLQALERSFDVSVEEGAGGWTLRLVPRSVRARRQLSSILVSGRGTHAACFITQEPDGDASYLLLGEVHLPAQPRPPERAWVREHCRVPGE